MSKRNIELLRERFLFLEQNHSLQFVNGECPGILGIVILHYNRNDVEFVRIEKERDFYDFIVITNETNYNYATICRDLELPDYSYDDYYGDKGLLKLANEVEQHFPQILVKYGS